MSDPYDLHRFVVAQRSSYDAALRELRAGHKHSHWMWFVFPQLAGLGRSQTARAYAISGIEEARSYLAHPVLGQRLVEASQALLGLGNADASVVLGPVDAMKLRSSMTLFAHAAPDRETFRDVLDVFFGGAEDPATTSLL